VKIITTTYYLGCYISAAVKKNYLIIKIRENGKKLIFIIAAHSMMPNKLLLPNHKFVNEAGTLHLGTAKSNISSHRDPTANSKI